MILGSVSGSSALFWNHFGHGDEAAEEPVPNPLPYTVALDAPGADRKLLKALNRASALVDQSDSPPSGVAGLVARARQDVGRITAVLYQNAYYEGQVSITIDGRPLSKIGPFDPVGESPVDVMVRVAIGEPFVFGSIEVAPQPGGFQLSDFDLVPGAPARSKAVLDAEAGLVEAWQAAGHPYAEATLRDTVADHMSNRLDVILIVDPGPRARFGRVTVQGTETVDPTLVAGRAHLVDGYYSPRAVDRAARRLRDLGVFDSVRIVPAGGLDPDGTVPMVITVSERKPRVIGASAFYSNTDGLELETYWRHRNLFGGAERLELSGSISRLITDTLDPDFRLAGRFTKPAVFDPLTDFTFRVEGYRETTEAYRVLAAETEAGLSHIFSDALTGSVSLELAKRRTTDDTGVTRDHLPLTLTGKLVWDSTDDRLDPGEGHRAELMAAPVYDFETDTTYTRFGTDLRAYWTLGDNHHLVVAARAAAAAVTIDDITKVAPDDRLYAGGAGSVRGYGYKNIGPRDATGDLVGGRSSVLFSGELRWRVSDRLGLVAFVDAGSASSTIQPQFDDLRVGVGGGVRYFTPVGPIRLDIAVPLQPDNGDPAVAVYVGLGQAF